MTPVYERLKNLQITLPDVPPPVGGWLRYRFRSVCPDRKPDPFIGAARKEGWKALVRQARRGDYLHFVRGKQAACTRRCHRITCHSSGRRIDDLNEGSKQIVKLLVFVNVSAGPAFCH